MPRMPSLLDSIFVVIIQDTRNCEMCLLNPIVLPICEVALGVVSGCMVVELDVTGIKTKKVYIFYIIKHYLFT